MKIYIGNTASVYSTNRETTVDDLRTLLWDTNRGKQLVVNLQMRAAAGGWSDEQKVKYLRDEAGNYFSGNELATLKEATNDTILLALQQGPKTKDIIGNVGR